MNTQYILGAYWSPRQQSVDDCAERLSTFVRDLCDCDPALATWFEKGRSRQQALQTMLDAGDREVAQRLLERGRHRRDTDGGVIEELGFRVGLWNGGRSGKEASLSVGCGLFVRLPKDNLRNSVVLTLPPDLDALSRAETMTRIVAAAARAWEPDWAGVMSRHAMNERSFDARTPFVDWIVYVPREIAAPESPSSVVPVPGLGSIVVVQPTPPLIADLDAAAHVERVGFLIRQSAAAQDVREPLQAEPGLLQASP